MALRKIATIVLFIFASLILFSCKSIPECISKNSKTISIKWGYTNNDNTISKNYMLATDMKVFELNENYKGKPVLLNEIKEDRFCSIFNQTTKTVLKTQILAEPCKECKYIELINPNMNIDIKLKWNSNYIHTGTKMVSELFDSLMVITKPVK